MKKRYFIAEGYMETLFKSFLAIDEDDLTEEEDLLNDGWIDCTDVLGDMEEVDRRQYETGHDVLYETRDGSKVLVYTSYRKGKGASIAFLPDGIETIEEAREYIIETEQEFFGIY